MWVLLSLALIIWNIFALWPKTHPEVSIPYSAFLSQLQASNVAKVHISGDEITGSFVKPIQWPESKEGTTDSMPANPKTSPTKQPPTNQPGKTAQASRQRVFATKRSMRRSRASSDSVIS